MKRTVFFAIISLIIAFILTLASCSNRKDICELDDNTPLDSIISTVYDISALDSYIKSRNLNAPFEFAEDLQKLYYNELNGRIPIEVTRAGEYSVYKVRNSGYYYVFFVGSVKDSKPIIDENSYVYFSSYINAPRDLSDFSTLTLGVSTAEDVKSIDPYFELNMLLSSGRVSYSYLNKEDLLEIKYFYSHPSNNFSDYSYNDLIISDINVIPRKQSASCYSYILDEDLP